MSCIRSDRLRANPVMPSRQSTPRPLAGLTLTAAAVASFGCHQARRTTTPEPAPTIADPAYLSQPLWNDGKAEVAFYEGWFEEPDGTRHVFEIGTYLIKHGFDVDRQSKAEAGGVPDFKWAFFFEFEAGSEQFKHSYVINAAQADLRPLKASMNSFDWCSNQYKELAFLPGGGVHLLSRSDDYGNDARTLEVQPLTYAAPQVPLLVRSADFSKSHQLDFAVLTLDGDHVSAMVEVVGKEPVSTPAGELEGEKILVHYAKSTPSIFGTPTTEEIFWRGTDPARTLLKMQSDAGTHGLKLVETVRSAYWQENVFSKLSRVKARP